MIGAKYCSQSQFQSQSMMIGAKYSSMAAPAVCRAVNCIGKWNRSCSFSLRSDTLSCRAVDASETKQQQVEEQDYSGTPYIPVYVHIGRGIIHPDYGLCGHRPYLLEELATLKSMNVDGVTVECRWDVVEHVPKHYDWLDYRELFQIVRDFKLKLQVVLSFHATDSGLWDCSGRMPLPGWVMQVGRRNPDIFFMESDGRRNHDCLSWGIDEERVLMNRTALEVYRDFMISFREEFVEFLEDGSISNVEIGLGPSGELRLPYNNDTPRISPGGYRPPLKEFQGEFPEIKNFQCYDKYMMLSLKKAWKERGDSLCGVRPTTGSSNSTNYYPELRHRYISFHGRFFLQWYSRVLVDHAAKLLSLGEGAFSGYCSISAKIPEICHLWYESSINVKGDAPIISVLKKYKTTLSSTVQEMRAIGHCMDFPEALADEIGIGWQLMYAAGNEGIPVSMQNARSFYKREGYQEILEIAKPINGRHYLSSFTYRSLRRELISNKQNLSEFGRFLRSMHGESTAD